MAQRERRKSGLDGRSPAQPLASMVVENAAAPAAAPAPASVPVTAPPVTPAQEVAAPAVVEQQAAQAAPAAPAAPVKKGKTPKTSFYQGEDDAMRMRGAFLGTKYVEGHGNLSEFINEAVMDKVRALEEKHNGGEPFRPMPPGGIGLGKPVRL